MKYYQTLNFYTTNGTSPGNLVFIGCTIGIWVSEFLMNTKNPNSPLNWDLGFLDRKIGAMDDRLGREEKALVAL